MPQVKSMVLWLLFFFFMGVVGSSSSALLPSDLQPTLSEPLMPRAADRLSTGSMLCSHIPFAPTMCKLFARMTKELVGTQSSLSL